MPVMTSESPQVNKHAETHQLRLVGLLMFQKEVLIL